MTEDAIKIVAIRERLATIKPPWMIPIASTDFLDGRLCGEWIVANEILKILDGEA